jgi:hypothetical protein
MGPFLLARALKCIDGPTRDERSTRLNLRIKNSHFGTIAAVDVKAKFATARCLHPPCTFTPRSCPPPDIPDTTGGPLSDDRAAAALCSRLISAMSSVERVVICARSGCRTAIPNRLRRRRFVVLVPVAAHAGLDGCPNKSDRAIAETIGLQPLFAVQPIPVGNPHRQQIL